MADSPLKDPGRRRISSTGRALRALRLSAGLSQNALAAALRQPQSLISKLESGERRLRLDECWVYASALGVDPSELFSAVGRAQAEAREAGPGEAPAPDE